MTLVRRRERQGTAAALTAANEVLLAGEWCWESDTGRVKIGNGTTGWNALIYIDGAGGGGVPTSRLITAGTRLTGGGSLAADRTLSIADGAIDTAALAAATALRLPPTPVTAGQVPTVSGGAYILATPTDAVLSVDGLAGAVALPVDGAAATGTKRTLGTGATQALPGNHASTTDARTPTAHKTTHATGGSDVLTPADIGAATTAALAGVGANGVSIGPMWQEPSARVAWAEQLIATSTQARPAFYDQSPNGTTLGTIDYPLWLPAGTWKATVETLIGPVAGIGEVLLDGSTFGTFDTYGTNTAYPAKVFRPTSAVTVATTGLHTFTIHKTGTKNAAATGYVAYFIAAHLRKTA